MLIISLSGFAGSFLNSPSIFVGILFGPHALSVRMLQIMSSISSSHDEKRIFIWLVKVMIGGFLAFANLCKKLFEVIGNNIEIDDSLIL